MPDLAVRERILRALVTIHEGISGAGTVRNKSLVQYQDSDLKAAYNIMDGGNMVSPGDDEAQTSGSDRYVMEALVQITSFDDEEGADLNAWYVDSIYAVLADRTLGGLCTDITQGGLDDVDVTDQTGQVVSSDFVLRYNIDFETKTNEPDKTITGV